MGIMAGIMAYLFVEFFTQLYQPWRAIKGILGGGRFRHQVDLL